MASKGEYKRRIANVTRVMAEHGIDCLLLNQTDNIRYLTGASNACSWVFVKQDGRQVALVLQSDYVEYRRQSILKDIRVFRVHDPFKHFQDLIEELDLKDDSLAVEKEHLRHFQFEMIESVFGARIHRAFGADYVAQEARMVKTPEEIEKLKEAARLAVVGMGLARQYATAGVTEQALARRVRDDLLARGAGSGTYLYVGSDTRSSLTHMVPTDNRIERGPVSVDIHVVREGYHADMARTILLDDCDPEHVEMYHHLKERIGATIQSIKDGTTLTDIKKRFYRSIELGPEWVILNGPLLHGVGVINSELPRFEYPYHNSGYPSEVQENMVLAMSNLGLCSEKGWGVRYEDMFLVTKDRPILLTVENE